MGALHIFPMQLLLCFYLFNHNMVFFNKETTGHKQFFPEASWGLLKKKNYGIGQQQIVVSDQL